MKKYAVIAENIESHWLGLAKTHPWSWMGLCFYTQRCLIGDADREGWPLYWKMDSFDAIGYDERLLQMLPWTTQEKTCSFPWIPYAKAVQSPPWKEMKKKLKEGSLWLPCGELPSSSEKAENCWIHGDSENQFAYRLARHIMSRKARLLPKGWVPRVYRVDSKYMDRFSKTWERNT